jgi:PAS domain-containing protein
VESASHRPLELILARNLLSSLSTPGMLVNQPGDVVFFNEAAGAVIGRRFEETGALPAAEWIKTYGPFDLSGEPIPLEDQPLTKALRSNRPGHTVQSLRSTSGETHQIEVSGFPIIGSDGFQGAIIFFWPAGEAVA